MYFNVKFTAHIRHIASGKIIFKQDTSPVKIIISYSSNQFTETLKQRERERPLGRPRRRWKDLKQIEQGDTE
jgi:hypothetical protein